MGLIGLLLGLLAIAAIAIGLWLIVTGNFVGGILILVGIVILYVANDRGYYRRTPL